MNKNAIPHKCWVNLQAYAESDPVGAIVAKRFRQRPCIGKLPKYSRFINFSSNFRNLRVGIHKPLF